MVQSPKSQVAKINSEFQKEYEVLYSAKDYSWRTDYITVTSSLKIFLFVTLSK